MDQAKRKRLEAKGWKVGSAADFLKLSEEDALYVEFRLRLSDAVRARRQAANLSQKVFAAAVGSSQSRVAKMEANSPSVALDLLIRSLIALGVSLAELGRIVGVDEGKTTVKLNSISRKAKPRDTAKKLVPHAEKTSNQRHTRS
jgi:transcriptional regulator with XRE-family HTH domain